MRLGTSVVPSPHVSLRWAVTPFGSQSPLPTGLSTFPACAPSSSAGSTPAEVATPCARSSDNLCQFQGVASDATAVMQFGRASARPDSGGRFPVCSQSFAAPVRPNIRARTCVGQTVQMPTVSREGLLPHAARASSLLGQRSTLHESRRFGLSTTATRVAPSWFHHHMPVWAGRHA